MTDFPIKSLWEGLKVRVAAAVVLVPAVLVCVWFGDGIFVLFLSGMAALMIWEWCRLVFPEQERSAQMAAQTISVIGALAFVYADLDHYGALVFCFGWLLSIVLSVFQARELTFWRAVGAVYLTVPIIALFMLRNDTQYGFQLVFWLLLVVWATDTFAMISGRIIGGPRMAPRISPKKTWSGLGGGVVGASLTAVIVAFGMDFPHLIVSGVLGAVVAVISQAGDVFESAAKRYHGVKDASNLIPGHGGILDRVDGLLFGAVFCAGLGFLQSGDLHRISGFLIW